MADSTRVRIAIASSRELEFEVDDVDEMTASIEAGLAAGEGLVWIVDSKGHRHGIRVENLAFVEIEGDRTGRGVGF